MSGRLKMKCVRLAVGYAKGDYWLKKEIKQSLLYAWHSCSFIIRSIFFHHGIHVHLPTGHNLQAIPDRHLEIQMDRSRWVLRWLLSLLIPFIPWIQLNMVILCLKFGFPTISKHHLITIANQVSGTKSTLYSWFKGKETILGKFEYNEIKAEFGFYSQTSVCMPRFCASTTESAWEYSTFLISLNFMLFIYMVIVYVVVHKKATGTKFSTSNRKDRNEVWCPGSTWLGLAFTWFRQGCQTSFEKKSETMSKKSQTGKKSQIVKNHEILAFSMCYHVFSKVVNKVNSTVTDYAHGNLKFSHFQYITFAAWSLNNFEGSLSCWWNSPMFLGFFMIHQVTDYCSEPFGIIVVWHNLQYAFSEQSLA